jgi:hypothetical protein
MDHLPPDLPSRSNNPNHFSKINSWPLILKRTTDRLLPHLTVPARIEMGRHHGWWRESSNLRYKAPNTMWFLPMQFRRWEELVLHTYIGENRRWKTGNSGVVWMTLGDGDWLLRWQEQDEQTPHVPLLLLRASISPGGDELNSHGKKSLVAWVWCLRDKIWWVRTAIYRACWSYS